MTESTTPQVLGGRYQLSDLLGYGGMAEVFRGRDIRLGREVAVKVLRSELARDPSFLTRFRREAQSAAALSHPNIVGVYDTGEEPSPTGPVPYIVMEYVEGRTLREVLQTEGKLLPRRALEIVAEVCAALEYSHENGIVHRDIKPGNVMITRSGSVKVMDFGIARALAASQNTVTQTSAVMGTAQYLSPEQARGEHVDARSDVYSTGILLYELLTGRPPFTGDSPVAVAYQHVREDPLPPSALDPELAGDLDAVVLKAIAKNPANRYGSAAAFGADLERAAAGRRVSATPVMAETRATTVINPAYDTVQTTVLARDAPDPHRARRGVAYSVLAAAVVAIVVVAALLVKNLANSGSSGDVAMPHLIGLSKTDAEQALTAKGLKYHETGVYQNNVPTAKQIPLNQVFQQSITDPFTVPVGSTVSFQYSLGLQTTVVPPVVNEQQDAATANLQTANLKVASPVPTEIDSLQPGTVVAVAPTPGSTLLINSTVTITVVANTKSVPDVHGLAVADATTKLQAAGFQVQVQDVNSTTVQAGLVISTTPGGGETGVTRGSTVTVYVAQTPPTTPPATTPPPTTTPPPVATTPATPDTTTPTTPDTTLPTTGAPTTSATPTP